MAQQLGIMSMAKWNDCNEPRLTDMIIMHLKLIPQKGCIRLKVITQN